MDIKSLQEMHSNKNLHRFSVFLACCTLILISLGGLVHSTGSGLSVPDWPTTYGQNMFTYPVSKWTGGIKYEHGHRLFASFVGFLMVIEFIWVWASERKTGKRMLRKISSIALFTVCIQGLLGGLTVRMLLPPAVSASHGMVAQSFLILTVWMSLATSKSWSEIQIKKSEVTAFAKYLFGITFFFTFVQIFLGALTRHTYSGLAIPDFPLAFGQIVPDFSQYSYQVVIHYCHRVGAFVLTMLTIIQLTVVLRGGKTMSVIKIPALIAAILIAIQITLGGLIVLTQREVIPNTAHVAVGSLLLITNAVIFFLSVRNFEVVRVKSAELFAVSSQIR